MSTFTEEALEQIGVLARQLREVTAERDRARDTAVALEQEAAQVRRELIGAARGAYANRELAVSRRASDTEMTRADARFSGVLDALTVYVMLVDGIDDPDDARIAAYQQVIEEATT